MSGSVWSFDWMWNLFGTSRFLKINTHANLLKEPDPLNVIFITQVSAESEFLYVSVTLETTRTQCHQGNVILIVQIEQMTFYCSQKEVLLDANRKDKHLRYQRVRPS